MTTMTTSNWRARVLFLLVTVAFLPVSLGNPLFAEREWIGKNGAKLLGRFEGKGASGSKALIRDRTGKLHPIGLENLSEPDQDFIRLGEAWKLPDVEEVRKIEALKMFRPIPELDRNEVPVIKDPRPEDEDGDPVVNAFAPFLLWWDQEGLLELPKKGDLDTKAAWLYPKLSRHFNTRPKRFVKEASLWTGWERYFKAEAGDIASFRLGRISDVSPESLAKWIVGADATVLQLSILQRRERYGHAVTLLAATADGSVEFICWGGRFTGTIKRQTPNPADKPSDPASYVLVFDDWPAAKARAPEWISGTESMFIMEPNWARLYTLRPFVYAEPGKPAPVPD